MLPCYLPQAWKSLIERQTFMLVFCPAMAPWELTISTSSFRDFDTPLRVDRVQS